MWYKCLFCGLLLVIVTCQKTVAQVETKPADTVKVKAVKPIVLNDSALDKPASKPSIMFNNSPRKAALFSAVLPGLGQVYNRKYWKVPIIYAGAIAVVYGYNFNNQNYQLFREAYILRRNGDNTAASLSQFYPDINQLSNARDYYRYYRDFSVILGILLYGMQMADAAVDAHLMSFSVKDDLVVSFAPNVTQLPNGEPTTGLSMRLTLGK